MREQPGERLPAVLPLGDPPGDELVLELRRPRLLGGGVRRPDRLDHLLAGPRLRWFAHGEPPQRESILPHENHSMRSQARSGPARAGWPTAPRCYRHAAAAG